MSTTSNRINDFVSLLNAFWYRDFSLNQKTASDCSKIFRPISSSMEKEKCLEGSLPFLGCKGDLLGII